MWGSLWQRTADPIPRPSPPRARAIAATRKNRSPEVSPGGDMPASVWKGHIAFGLITIPVRLLRAARSERVPLRELYRAESPAPRYENDENDEDVAPSSPAAAKGAVRIDRKREPEPEPAPEPIFEPVGH